MMIDKQIEEMENTGYWMDSSLPDDAFKKEQCSICGKWSRDVGKMYCPHCGSLNGGKQDGSDKT